MSLPMLQSPLFPFCLMGCLSLEKRGREGSWNSAFSKPTASHTATHICSLPSPPPSLRPPHLLSMSAEVTSYDPICPLGTCHSIAKVAIKAQGIANRTLESMGHTRKQNKTKHEEFSEIRCRGQKRLND